VPRRWLLHDPCDTCHLSGWLAVRGADSRIGGDAEESGRLTAWTADESHLAEKQRELLARLSGMAGSCSCMWWVVVRRGSCKWA